MALKTSSERLGEALERARRHWQAHYRSGGAVEVPAAPQLPALTVAVSREAGTNASAVAHVLGTRLGWAVYDRELLQHIAGEMGLRAELLDCVDEKGVGWGREFLASLSSEPAVSQGGYLRHLVETLCSLSARGACVIVGRGAAQVLPADRTLRVRLVAPLEDRIASVRARFGFGPEEAARWVEKTDHERTRFVKDHFHKDPSLPAAYDLTLNAARFSAGECAAVIAEALDGMRARMTPAGLGRPAASA